MKAAILADIHGNSIALREVLGDIEALGGVDAYWFLGDYTAIGHDPLGVMGLISMLPNAWFIRGNTDRFLATGDLPGPYPAEVKQNPALIQVQIEVARSFAWTAGAVSTAGWLPWFRNLPLDHRFSLPDGTQVLAVHAAPGTDDGMGIYSNITPAALSETIYGAAADLLLVGHTHIPFDLRSDGVRVINPGSVSNPFPPDLRASYVILEADEHGYQVDFRRVAYDHNAVIQAVQELNHPGGAYISLFMQGEVRKDWSK